MNLALRSESILDIFDNYEYSTEDSLQAFKSFLENQTEYKENYIKKLIATAGHVHQRYPKLKFLQNTINKKGLIGAEFEKDCTAYFHFLCMIGILSISFTDFFNVNPKTINKLKSWYKPYYDLCGIDEFLENFTDVAERTKSKNVNLQRSLVRVESFCVYVLMRYRLGSVGELSEQQWVEIVGDLRNATNKPAHIFPNQLIGQTLFERGMISAESITCFADRSKKQYSYKDLELIKPVVDLYESYLDSKYSKEVKQHKLRALELFFDYCVNVEGVDSIKDINRRIINDFKTYYISKGFSSSENEVVIYGVKQFMSYIDANNQELKMKGFEVPSKKLVVKKDYKIKAVSTLPRPIKPQLFELFLNKIRELPDKKFGMAFLLMTTTGIGVAELMALEYDCLQEMADGSYKLRIYRVKLKKYYEVKVRPEVVRIITNLQKYNTQKVPMKHPSGEDVIYLINDGGRNLTNAWFKTNFKKLKNMLAEEHPEYSEEINNISPHQIRHTFATRMRDNGADIYTLCYLMGHESINTTKKYVKESDRIKQSYIDQLNERYVCDAIDDISVLTGTEKGLAAINEILEAKNNIGLGICVANKADNCPLAYQCIDCIYLCSTLDDLPELYGLLEGLKDAYDDLVSQEELESAEVYKKRMLRLIAKIRKLEERRVNLPEIE